MFINIVSNCQDWQEAIRISAKPMLDSKMIEQTYVDRIIYEVQENGPYICIAPNIALPHTRPEYGVNKSGISILKVNTPVNILGQANLPVQLFVFLAAVDNNSHIDILQKVTSVLSDKQKLDKIFVSSSLQELKQIFAN